MGEPYEANYFGSGPIPQMQTPRTCPEPRSWLTHDVVHALVCWLATQGSSHPHNLSSRNNVLEAHFFRGSESFTYIISFDAFSSVKKVEGGDYHP